MNYDPLPPSYSIIQLWSNMNWKDVPNSRSVSNQATVFGIHFGSTLAVFFTISFYLFELFMESLFERRITTRVVSRVHQWTSTNRITFNPWISIPMTISLTIDSETILSTCPTAVTRIVSMIISGKNLLATIWTLFNFFSFFLDFSSRNLCSTLNRTNRIMSPHLTMPAFSPLFQDNETNYRQMSSFKSAIQRLTFDEFSSDEAELSEPDDESNANSSVFSSDKSDSSLRLRLKMSRKNLMKVSGVCFPQLLTSFSSRLSTKLTLKRDNLLFCSYFFLLSSAI